MVSPTRNRTDLRSSANSIASNGSLSAETSLRAAGLGEGGRELLVVERRLARAVFGVDQDEFALASGQVVAVPEPVVLVKPVRGDAGLRDEGVAGTGSRPRVLAAAADRTRGRPGAGRTGRARRRRSGRRLIDRVVMLARDCGGAATTAAIAIRQKRYKRRSRVSIPTWASSGFDDQFRRPVVCRAVRSCMRMPSERTLTPALSRWEREVELGLPICLIPLAVRRSLRFRRRLRRSRP